MPFNEEAFNELKEKLLASVNGHNKEKRLAMGLYALAYAKHGYPVFPLHEKENDGECSCGRLNCKSLGKHPRHAGWQSQATVDAGLIRSMWGEYPTANVGVACGEAGNLTVLDVDGDAGRASLRELELEHGELPETRMVITGRGGNHYYFDYEPGVIGRTHIAEGLDLRTEGNLVVGVGSRTTGEYVWAVGYSPQDLPQAQMPQWLKKLGQKTVREVTTTDQNQRPQVPIEQAAQMLRYINAEKRRDIWFDVCKACKSEWGRHGRKLWDDWARQYAPFDEDDQNKTWASINVDGGTTIGTLIKLAKDGGWVPSVNGNGHLPAVDEIDRTPVDAFEAYTQMLADKREYSWRGIIREGCTMVLAALMGSGKTTLSMNVTRGWALGEPVLGRDCKPSKTLVVVSSKEWDAWADTIGFWQIRGQIFLIPSYKVQFGDGREQAAWFEQTMKQLGCTTFAFDTMFDFFGIPPHNTGDMNRMVMAEQTPLLEVVRVNGWSGIVTGHPPKSEAQAPVNRDPEESFGGATAWSAQHRMRAVIYRKAQGKSTFRTARGGYGDEGLLEEKMLLFDEVTRLLSLGGKWSEYLGSVALPSICLALENGEGWMGRSALVKATGKGEGWVKAGVKEGLRTGDIKSNGRDGRARKYALKDEPEDGPPPPEQLAFDD